MDPVTLASRGLCTIITSGDLAFSPEETDGYLASRGLKMTGRAVAEIYEHTEGWISAIFLVSEGVRNGLAAVGQGGIDMLIEENFLSVLDEESRGMLVKLSSLDYFTAQQAVFVLHSEKAATLLVGMFGVALATGLSYLLAAGSLLKYYLSASCSYQFVNPLRGLALLGVIVSTGLPNSLNFLWMTINSLAVNRLLVSLGGLAALTACSVMKILILNGSPKGERSATLKLARAFAEGVRREGEELDLIDLSKQNVSGCRGCFGCWANGGTCVIRDDFPALFKEHYLPADLVLWSFPLYYFEMPSQLKAFLDRTFVNNWPDM